MAARIPDLKIGDGRLEDMYPDLWEARGAIPRAYTVEDRAPIGLTQTGKRKCAAMSDHRKLKFRELVGPFGDFIARSVALGV
jgi:hypothetical protein